MTETSNRARSRAGFGITRSLYFWPLCVLLGPQCLTYVTRAVVVLLAGATVSSTPRESAAGDPERYDISACLEEAEDCNAFCEHEYRGGPPGELEECRLVCEEIYDTCVAEKSGRKDQGCDADDAQTAEAIACTVLYGLEACAVGAECVGAEAGGTSDALAGEEGTDADATATAEGTDTDAGAPAYAPALDLPDHDAFDDDPPR